MTKALKPIEGEVLPRAGRPTKYTEEMPARAIEYFSRAPFKYATNDKGETLTDKNGQPFEVVEDFPIIEGLADYLGIVKDTLYQWVKEHPDFSDSIKACRDKQKNFLIQQGLHGRYDRTFAIFVAKNCTDMHDQRQIEHSGRISFTDMMEELEGG
jgi:hypothetical protein